MSRARSAACRPRGFTAGIHGPWQIGPDTLLRLVQAVPTPDVATPEVLGVDEWAWRRGQRYGTILVDLEDHRVLDLLPERSAVSLAAWLAQHPSVTIVCRDRSA